MKFIRGYGYQGEQPRLYAERVLENGYHWKLLGMSGLLAEGYAEDFDQLITQATETAEEFTS